MHVSGNGQNRPIRRLTCAVLNRRIQLYITIVHLATTSLNGNELDGTLVLQQNLECNLS